MTLETTLADLRERVTMLRVEGHPCVQDAGERTCMECARIRARERNRAASGGSRA